ncbi:pkinase-domain-containing protein [Moesziomyces antarcticus]|uniref:[RNA-polymerase]-subunit kinase n=1 Tax=Pseudozyma antarctica TaxID=84753 RepID=A0A081CNQ7_PSEA2|nr:pkinase-domain-containing protein [Moesziomyces antarcticus]GAK68303.1 pkinase-domain-containing protein [Moesziomyces antarcticus]
MPDRWQRRRNDEPAPRGADADRRQADFPNKARRIDDSSSRRGSERDAHRQPAAPSITIRGVAAKQASPDLLDRLARRTDDDAPAKRPAGESARPQAEARRGGAKLAPRGQYDDTGRRMDAPTSSHRGDAHTSPRRRDADGRRHRDRSPSPAAQRQRRRDDDERHDRRREARGSHSTRRRSPSPEHASTSAPRWDRDRYGSYDRHRSPPSPPDRYASQSRRTAPAPRGGEAESSRRRRTPSPTRSDTSSRSRRREREPEPVRKPARDRPARWKLDSREEERATERRDAGRERRRSPEPRRPRTPPRIGRDDEADDRGHVLSRKSAPSRAAEQEQNGARREAEAELRSVRGSGWQTVRPGSRNGKSSRDDDRSAPTAPVEAVRAEAGEAYESIQQVGEGTYGQVFKARSERTGAVVALKKIRMDSEKDGFPVTAMREIKLLQALRHENVVRLHEMMVTRGSVYMVFEYMEHDLNGILAHPQVQFTPAHLKSLATQLLSGLAYLHRKAVLHRDLKGSNILLNNQGRLKLADFGLARMYAKRRQGDYTNRVVTLWYRPPELLFGATQYGSEVDMWGAGCIFLELFVKKPVFQGESELGQIHSITDVLGPVTVEAWRDADKLAWYEMVKPPARDGETEARDYVKAAFGKYMPDAALEVARGLLTYDPQQRWSAQQALQAAYFSEEPHAEPPAGLLSALEGEWHEYESRRAKKKASAQPPPEAIAGPERTGAATTAQSSHPVA